MRQLQGIELREAGLLIAEEKMSVLYLSSKDLGQTFVIAEGEE